MNLLSAINLCLRGANLAQISSEDEEDLDASLAKQIILDLTEQVQNKPYWFNLEPNWVLTPDYNGNIQVPATATSVVTSGKDVGKSNIAIRSGKLYDTYNHTYDMRNSIDGGSITVSFVMQLAWEDLPPIVQTYIAYSARRQFSQDLNIDQTRLQAHYAEESEAKSVFLVEDGKNKKRNYLTDNATNANIINTIGGQNTPFPVTNKLGSKRYW